MKILHKYNELRRYNSFQEVCFSIQKGLQLKKRLQTQVCICEYCDIFKNIYSEEHLRTVDSEYAVQMSFVTGKKHGTSQSSQNILERTTATSEESLWQGV